MIITYIIAGTLGTLCLSIHQTRNKVPFEVVNVLLITVSMICLFLCGMLIGKLS